MSLSDDSSSTFSPLDSTAFAITDSWAIDTARRSWSIAATSWAWLLQRKLFPATGGLPRSIRETHGSLTAGMPGLPSWPDDHGQVIGRGSFSPGHSRYGMT